MKRKSHHHTFVEDVGLKSTAATAEIVVLPPNQSPECQFTDLNAEGFGMNLRSLFWHNNRSRIANEQLIVIWTSNLDGDWERLSQRKWYGFLYHETLSVGTHLITLQATDEGSNLFRRTRGTYWNGSNRFHYTHH